MTEPDVIAMPFVHATKTLAATKTNQGIRFDE